ncbi:MAG: CDP-glycerol glycerophosphotransferase family protein [Methanobrevibacter sp.]|nr:CDP-glycerol glycerophosphotransferase family protein [Methanobrevibacter sp.]
MLYIKKTIRDIVIFFYRIIFHLLPLKKNIILFESSNGRNYTGNPKYIYEYLLNSSKKDKFKYVWSLEDTSFDIPGNPVKVRRTRLKYLYYSIVSNFWIFDSRHPQYLLKKKNCVYIQTWHGTPLKKLALDMEKLNMSGKTNIEEYKADFRENTSFWDFLIGQNDFSVNIFKRAFDFNGKFLKIGYPRNDILINEKKNAELISKIKKKLKIAKNKKIILYAPTWRDNQFHSDGLYKFSSNMDFDSMKERLANDYILIIKYHYLVKENIDWTKYSDFIIIADEKQDIQELYLISDILITDYSSVMFDYSLLKKPMIFYTYDLEFYKKNLRGFYFNIEEEVPGPIIENNEDLITFLENFSLDDYFLKYESKYSKFMERYNQYDKGEASKEVAKLIISNS